MLIDPKSTIPIFRQIADQLRQSIESSVYRPGEMLPSLRALAIEIKVNPNTVQRAYDALEREGVVETRRGVGIFVVVSDRRKLTAAEARLNTQLLSVIQQGVKAGLTPDAVRITFENAMRLFLAGAKQ
jgi:DNA-binding transcriptional regulator YhcF (GntR family)